MFIGYCARQREALLTIRIIIINDDYILFRKPNDKFLSSAIRKTKKMTMIMKIITLGVPS